MPLVSIGGAPPQLFYNTEDILNRARVAVNDAQASLAGQDLADDRPYTWTLLNMCYEDLANQLEDSNVESAMYAEAIISLPASSAFTDPNAQSHLDYTGYTDAAGFTYESPTLPSDLIEPLQLWQRATEQNVPFRPMRQKLGGLGAQFGASIYGGLNGDWEFRQNGIYFLGAAFQGTDIRIRYIPSLPELLQPTPEDPTAPTIWFARAGLALAYMVAAEFMEIRGAKNAPLVRAKANAQLKIIANKSAKRENQTQTRRRGYGFKRGRRRTWL